mmetsp:Transcript_18023/g.32711  ORF Transcript_18023/g.32711 Transcript_18023/m.32711 type:complete len:214 (+) Transcript_18023:352-993(+)
MQHIQMPAVPHCNHGTSQCVHRAGLQRCGDLFNRYVTFFHQGAEQVWASGICISNQQSSDDIAHRPDVTESRTPEIYLVCVVASIACDSAAEIRHSAKSTMSGCCSFVDRPNSICLLRDQIRKAQCLRLLALLQVIMAYYTTALVTAHTQPRIRISLELVEDGKHWPRKLNIEQPVYKQQAACLCLLEYPQWLPMHCRFNSPCLSCICCVCCF